MKKKIAAAFVSIVLLISAVPTYALTDDFILADEVQSTYTGRIEAAALIENLNFSDIAGHWAQEPVVRSGALNLVKGYGDAYQPDAKVSNAEALAFVLRAIGRENEAVALGAQLQAQAPADSPLRTAWALGYLTIANDLGMITPQEYASAITPAGTNGGFNREAEATRERVADWIVKGLRSVDEAAFLRDAAAAAAQPAAEDIVPDEAVSPKNATVQRLLNYTDFDSVSALYADSVDLVTLNGLMSGDGEMKFNPKNGVTRAEVAQILKNMDSHYYDLMSFEKKTGVVGTTRDNRYKTTGDESVWRNIYIRSADGTMDNLQYSQQADNDVVGTQDAVVFKNNAVVGLAALSEGDEIEYIVNTATNQLLYVQVVKGLEKTEINAYLYAFNAAEGTVNLRDGNNNHLLYSMMAGIFVNEDGVDYVRMDDERKKISDIPIGSILKLELTNNIVTRLTFIGQPAVVNEIRGIVTENNPSFGYLTVIGNNGESITKYYYESDLTVEKQMHYDADDEIGYIDEVFPNFDYDPRDTAIAAIEPGDIVFMRLSPDDPNTIASISASPNYLMKYGKIRQITNGPAMSSFMIEYEDHQTAWFDAPNTVFASKDGKPIAHGDIKIGDWAKLLVNQAILAPGNVAESVKEIAVEGDEHFISGIVKGSLSGINDVQKELVVKDSYALTKTGWTGYQNLSTYDLSGSDTEVYYNDQRISLDYAKHYLAHSDATVYVALENNYAGDRVKKVTFRLERDEALPADTVIYANGGGAFDILSHGESINADGGTIVRRHGRLVEAQDIMGSDYAYVVLNGEDKAAVVDIIEAPSTSGIMVARGRILSVEEGQSFKVQSMSVLAGNEWIFTPVQREFSIDHNTLFIGPDGISDSANFMDYTEESAVDKVYNIIVDGSRAAYVVDSPYCTKGIKGTIYAIEDGVALIKDAYVYDNDTGKWQSVSARNATLSVALPPEAIIAKNNAVTTAPSLEIGDQLRVMTNGLPDRVAPGTEVNGYIVIVEK